MFRDGRHRNLREKYYEHIQGFIIEKLTNELHKHWRLDKERIARGTLGVYKELMAKIEEARRKP